MGFIQAAKFARWFSKLTREISTMPGVDRVSILQDNVSVEWKDDVTDEQQKAVLEYMNKSMEEFKNTL